MQIRFAENLVILTGQPIDDVLAEHTVFHQLLGLPKSDQAIEYPQWQTFVDGIRQQSDKVDWAYNFCLDHAPTAHAVDEVGFGCFTYDFYFRPAIKLHFRNPKRERVLGQESVETRQLELKQLFMHIKVEHPDAKTVRGSSWLYNIEAYRRLFPPNYVATAKPVGYETGFYSLWGQFLHADRSIRESMADRFLLCLAKQKTAEGCLACFPCKVLRPECPIEVFYEFYGIGLGYSCSADVR